MSAFGCKADIDATLPNVCFWHEADMRASPVNVRFWGKSGNQADQATAGTREGEAHPSAA